MFFPQEMCCQFFGDDPPWKQFHKKRPHAMSDCVSNPHIQQDQKSMILKQFQILHFYVFLLCLFVFRTCILTIPALTELLLHICLCACIFNLFSSTYITFILKKLIITLQHMLVASTSLSIRSFFVVTHIGTSIPKKNCKY